MTLETGTTPPASGFGHSLKHGLVSLKVFLRQLNEFVAPAAAFVKPLTGWLSATRIARFISGSLLRRILIANLVGLILMLAGILYLSQHHEWLIAAKRDSLKAQGEIIAGAIGANATIENGEIKRIEAEKLPSSESSRAPYRDDGFAALELSLNPEQIARILNRLVRPDNKMRVRIYGRDGTMIVDNARFLQRGQITRPDLSSQNQARPKTKNFWTRITEWLIDGELPVYREIGTANGTAYPEVRKALEGAPATPMLLLSERRQQIVSMAVPIVRAKAVQGALLLSTRPGEIDEILSEERWLILTLFGFALFAAIATSLLLARTVAEPMKRLSHAAELVSRDINARRELPEYADREDEVGQMAEAFTAMTDALYKRIEASEKFAADVAHELKNPLTAARSTAESLIYAKTPEERDHLVEQIQGELKRLNRLITDVSNASRLDAELARQHMLPLNVKQVLASVAGIFTDVLDGESRRVVISEPPGMPPAAFTVRGDEGRLGQVFTNLLDNALSFSPEGGTVTVSAVPVNGGVDVTVDDEGPGIPEDRLLIVFDRFYTDRPATEAKRGKNSGLGLSISREIINAHGGQLWAENRYGETDGSKLNRLGARFVVRLPSAAIHRGGSIIGRRA